VGPGKLLEGLSETFVSRLGSQHEWCEIKWEIWPKMIDKEGALLNPEVAGPQCQEQYAEFVLEVW